MTTSYQFTPPPKHPPQWWKKNGGRGIAIYFDSGKPAAWHFHFEESFATATDALLWLRLIELPIHAGIYPDWVDADDRWPTDAETIEVATEIIKRIDEAPSGMDSATLLEELEPMLKRMLLGDLPADTTNIEWCGDGLIMTTPAAPSWMPSQAPAAWLAPRSASA